MIVSVLVSMFFTVIALYVPGLNDFLDLEPIDGGDWVKILIAVVIHFILVEIEKWVFRYKNW